MNDLNPRAAVHQTSVCAPQKALEKLPDLMWSSLKNDQSGQSPLVSLVVIIGLAIMIIGLAIVNSNVGFGLIWIGTGAMVGGFGGYAFLKHPLFVVEGGSGVVLVLVGALLRSVL